MAFALVTGASVGIGRALALECARDGLDIVLVARSEARLAAVAKEIRGLGREAVCMGQDLVAPDGARLLHAAMQARGIKIDVLINNAGFGLMGRFWDLPEAEQMQMLHVNIGALTQLTRLFLPEMIAARRGFVLNVASTAAFQPGPLMAVYYASKAYVLSFSEALFNEAREFGVAVTALCPGPTESEFAQRAGVTNANLFKKRNVMTAEQVGRIGYAAMKRRKPLAIAGRTNAVVAFLTRLVPIQTAARIARTMQES